MNYEYNERSSYAIDTIDIIIMIVNTLPRLCVEYDIEYNHDTMIIF